MTTTLDTNHLRKLRKATRHIIGCQMKAPCALHSNANLMCDYCRFHFECYHGLPELLDRSDALDEALQLLRERVQHTTWCFYNDPFNNGICTCDKEKVRAFLSRFPQETK